MIHFDGVRELEFAWCEAGGLRWNGSYSEHWLSEKVRSHRGISLSDHRITQIKGVRLRGPQDGDMLSSEDIGWYAWLFLDTALHWICFMAIPMVFTWRALAMQMEYAATLAPVGAGFEGLVLTIALTIALT